MASAANHSQDVVITQMPVLLWLLASATLQLFINGLRQVLLSSLVQVNGSPKGLVASHSHTDIHDRHCRGCDGHCCCKLGALPHSSYVPAGSSQAEEQACHAYAARSTCVSESGCGVHSTCSSQSSPAAEAFCVVAGAGPLPQAAPIACRCPAASAARTM